MSIQTFVSPPANDSITQTGKILYIDNLKVLLTVLVVLHHTFITYGAPGGWYYAEKTTNLGAQIPMTLFVAINQSFFMGFFFFIAAYFTGPSYCKKGAARFTADRLKRLGIPLVFYSFILSPVLSYLVYRFAQGNNITYFQYLSGFHSWIDFGVLWFVAALLLFSLLYAGIMQLLKGIEVLSLGQLPHTQTIILFILTLVLGSYLARCVFPIGWVLKPVGFQLGHFVQYIALFVLGIVACNGQWLSKVSYKMGKGFAVMAFVMIVIVFPIIYFVKVATNSPAETFNGNGHWQSLMYAGWEQFTGMFIIIALLGLAKQKWNSQTSFMKTLSRSAFGVYIFHPLVLISLSMLFRPWGIDPAVKLLVVAPLAVAGSFGLAHLLLKIPGVKAVI
ncbi:acyltransferase [Mucilaginibacter pocheonensis]|uniref:Surface polysaccharide O-acyltransferase-like enzyme n=1 Tax=Mucilaginibacter pocheonensis TaxID=398050 RepID=A0ABU1THX7_9SPHI|nr:acyltransferase [Mucilaginibacter pocheonensis]MDR6944963.1 surface polysaccharide O-acyltransferase-like enzyme [Mucilaginibacter pocheonensis]